MRLALGRCLPGGTWGILLMTLVVAQLGIATSGCSTSTMLPASATDQPIHQASHQGQSGPAATPLQGRLVLTGSSTIAPLIVEIAKRFEAQHPQVRVEVQTGGSTRGISDARQRTADFGMVSRNLKPVEGDLVAYEIARDGICLIVHADNPVPSLSREQVLAVYRDEVSDWKEIGGPPVPIVAVHKAEGRGTLEVFLSHFELQNEDVHPDVIAGDNLQAIKSVAGNPYAVGYVSIGAAEAEARLGTAIRLLPAGEIAATSGNVAEGRFPMVRPLNLVAREPLSPLASAFLAFVRSGQHSDLIEAQYFVPVAQ